MPAPTVIVLRDRASLAAIAPAWEELAATALELNPFYEPWLLLPALRARGDLGLECVSVWQDATLIGLFPFERRSRFRRLPVETLSSWRHSSHLLCTPLVRRDAAIPALRALMRWAASEASVLELLYLQASGPFDDALREAAGTLVRTAQFSRPLLVKAANADAYMEEAASGRLRRQIRRNERRLAGRGAETVVVRPGDAIGDEIERFLRLEVGGWKGRQGGALASDSANLRFGREVLVEAHRRGRLHVAGIDCDGAPIARRLSILSGDGAYAFKTAYDEDYAAYSPGVLAEALCLRDFHSLPGARWMDACGDNPTLNRMWKHRRSMQSVAVGIGAWGAFWLSVYSSIRGTAQTAETVRPAA
jgi:CelD/BcsL family acetyltransferase involved in cellulose biosynthesis